VDAWIWWLVAGVALAVVEILTLDLVFVMLSAGTVAAAGIAGLDAAGAPLGFGAQLVGGLAVAVLGLVLLRPVALRHLRDTPELRTGTAALIGADALVTDRVDRLGGRVKLAGEIWSARSYHPDGVFEQGTAVSVLWIDGATALVG